MNGKRILYRLSSLKLLPLLMVTLLFFVPPALAQTKIGLIMPGGDYFGADIKDRFQNYLTRAGISPGDVEIILQRPSSDKVSRLNAIRKLVAHEMDILVTFGASASSEAARETKKTPIIFIGAQDPVKQKLVDSLERPGQNVTGVSGHTSPSFLIERVMESTTLRILGVLHKSESLNSRIMLEEIQELAAKRGFRIIAKDVVGATLDDVSQAMAQAQFIYLAIGSYSMEDSECDIGALNRPIASQSLCSPIDKVVYFLAPNLEELLSAAADLTGRVIRGEKPSNMPVSPLKKVDFIVNMKMAEKVGIKVPFATLSRATKVIK